jgi:hypothetical protein
MFRKEKNLEDRLQALESSYIELMQRHIELDKRMNHLVVPAVNDLLTQTIFQGQNALSGKPGLLIWVMRRLSQEGISQEMRQFLAQLVEKIILPPKLQR